ncbi:serine/threonine-protein kinase [Wenzhouxiangella sediminis]|uniref:Protein kinase domain-containing protein n=1 Tax=Wenzhouxiangella sediminis TaxID=1792836 RepID=A0A3E1K5R2_9GAMM|nr:serine/threonine-protein kinase [Wenzhouxiangella sediminis]RFF29359.1 hypothetical protein DZC52_12975 [Wenzhouxiangella sediminis]
MSGDDPLRPGGALEGRLFQRFLTHLSQVREPEPGERIGAWKILRELGRGGSGVVYLAERADGAYDQQVALKWLRSDRPVPGGREVLAREREMLASLDHPNIARLIDGGETDDGMRWFAMDFAPGETIDRAVEPFDRRERVELVGMLCRAVHHAHRRGLIHGDIKPSNVLVDEQRRPRLVDFGISRLRRAGPGSSYGMTPDYASPEQRAGADLTTASDIWQLGHLLEDLLEDSPGADALPADLSAIVQRATQAAPEDRYASASAMAADIEAWLGARPVAARNGGPVYRLSRFVRRNRALSAVSVLALLVIVVGGAWLTWQLALERDRARMQAERAEAALAETESALARAEALRDFLIGLFRAAEPDRPRNQLPSTENLLALGARRALREDSAPPGERVSMLLTLAHVYLTRTLREEAEPLLAEAVRLGRESVDERPEDLARALHLQGYAALSAQRYDRAEQRLAEAESVAAGHPRARETWIAARAHRGWLRLITGRSREALELVEPVYETVESGSPAESRGRLQLTNTLAFALSSTGSGARAFEVRQRAAELSRRLDGPQSRGYAIQLGNLGGQALSRGRLNDAEDALERAIALYDRIYQRPVALRATARANLANLHLHRGEYDKALASIRDSAREWADVEDRRLEDYEFYHHHRGRLLSRMNRWEAAESALARARELFAGRDRPKPLGRMMTAVYHERAKCRLGRTDTALDTLDALAARLIESGRDTPERRGELAESKATCLHFAGRHEQALAEIRKSLEAFDPPGYAMVRAQRQLLRADVLSSLERAAPSRAAAAEASRLLREAGLGSHPVLSRAPE